MTPIICGGARIRTQAARLQTLALRTQPLCPIVSHELGLLTQTEQNVRGSMSHFYLAHVLTEWKQFFYKPSSPSSSSSSPSCYNIVFEEKSQSNPEHSEPETEFSGVAFDARS